MQSRYGDPQYILTIAALKKELNRLRKQYQVEELENP
jgi:ribosomal protein L29